MGTTAAGLPYPEPTDPVAEGANAIKALAQAIDPKFMSVTYHSTGTAQSSISTIRTTCTRTIPSAPYPRTALVAAAVHAAKSVAADVVQIAVALNGTNQISATQDAPGAGSTVTMTRTVDLPANTAHTLTLTVTRSGGTGTLSTFADGRSHYIQATVLPGAMNTT